MQPSQVIDFWTEAGPAHWFARDESFDRAIIERFGAAHEAAAAGALAAWERTPEGALALLLLLDQFPRNMFRGQARAFATDAQALAIAERAIAAGQKAEVLQAAAVTLRAALSEDQLARLIAAEAPPHGPGMGPGKGPGEGPGRGGAPDGQPPLPTTDE